MTTIRLAVPDDLPQLSALFDAYRVFYEQPSDIPLARKFIAERLDNKDSVIFVALDSELKLIGFCQIYPSFCSVIAARIGVLYDLFVDPSVRKKRGWKSTDVSGSRIRSSAWVCPAGFDDRQDQSGGTGIIRIAGMGKG